MNIKTNITTVSADCFTPVGLFLKLRDHYGRIVLLESSDYSRKEGSFSYIAFEPMADLIIDSNKAIIRTPEADIQLDVRDSPVNHVNRFLHFFQFTENVNPAHNGVFGFTTFDAISVFESGVYRPLEEVELPFLYYSFYRFILVFDHFRNRLEFIENQPENVNSEIRDVLTIVERESVPGYSFALQSEAIPNMTDEDFKEMVDTCKQHCQLGNVFQIVPSRCYEYHFKGDDFQVYRNLRSINPSPYLFYFDYGNYRLFGSSPEAQIIVAHGMAELHPIAGTIRRTMDEAKDREHTQQLLHDPKENAEHIMLVDLARNDLSKNCTQVEVASYREVQYFSHVIHLVSRVTGKLKPGVHPYQVFADCFPQGTLSGAPKIRAIEIIQSLEPTSRGYYGGAIGKIGFDSSINHAIMIRSFYSRGNRLRMQAGAGVVIDSDREYELKEVKNKLSALEKAIRFDQSTTL